MICFKGKKAMGLTNTCKGQGAAAGKDQGVPCGASAPRRNSGIDPKMKNESIEHVVLIKMSFLVTSVDEIVEARS
jgi:hypothetical protein